MTRALILINLALLLASLWLAFSEAPPAPVHGKSQLSLPGCVPPAYDNARVLWREHLHRLCGAMKESR